MFVCEMMLTRMSTKVGGKWDRNVCTKETKQKFNLLQLLYERGDSGED